MKKWREWATLDKEPESVKPLDGYEWAPATIDVYGKKLDVLQMKKIGEQDEQIT